MAINRSSTLVVRGFRGNRECRISANTCGFYSHISSMPCNPTQLPESCKGYHRSFTDLHSKSLPEVDGLSSASFLKNIVIKKTFSFRLCAFTQILRYSHAVLDCASMKAEVWTCPDMSGPVGQSGASVWNRGTGAAVNQLPVRNASFPFTLIISSGYLASQFGEVVITIVMIWSLISGNNPALNLQIHSIHTH
ncbi:hypothetical protein T11_14558 [Trichinella zimbabwensis]|uniref:Uncharacterized protein n=1 Tax=Trichinella zimbabwensis TaxID=268475 RepID=A0A0V1I8C8_9BILA|nr:hypothetical protein T11_14558 [Trichinella zimbabwensis]